MDDIARRVASHELVGLDTSIWIYHLELNPRYAAVSGQVLTAIQNGRTRAIHSVLTILEVTVRPHRLGQPGVAAYYEAMLSHFPNARLVNVTPTIARHAAQLRATFALQTADALHVATSLVHGATAWVTNDHKLRRLTPVVDVILLDDFIAHTDK